MTEPQRHKLVFGGIGIVVACLVLYLIVFGFRALDAKALVLLIAFSAVAIKISTIKHKHNPMV